MRFNFFAQLREEIEDFDQGGVYIVGKPRHAIRFKDANAKGMDGGYYFSQKDTLEAVDMACASKFKSGPRDREGQRKAFLNIVNFFIDVMTMKIMIKMANYIFEPRTLDFTWPVFLLDRQFKLWADTESYDDQLEEYARDLSKYGTTVSKKLKDCTERVPLRTLRNTQTARTLFSGCQNGGYAIIESEMHYNLMKEYPGWDLEGVKKGCAHTIYERYGLVPRSLLENQSWKTQTFLQSDSENEEMVLAVAILLPNEGLFTKKKTEIGGRVLFMEELDEHTWPLEECHVNREDGRWLGKGEGEKQLENQIARNLGANLRRRGILWGTKKIFQSSDPEMQKNLVFEVKDGEVLYVRPNGLISQVNTGNQHSGDISTDEKAWDENSKQISFAFNVGTGEELKSNTPFRLGLLLDKNLASHFTQLRGTFSNFLKRSFFDQLIPIFQDQYSDAHEMHIPIGASDIENLKEAMIVFHTNTRVFNDMMKGKTPITEMVRMEVEEELARSSYLFLEIPEKFYNNARFYMKLNLDEDIGPDVQTLTTIWQDLNAKGDPRADNVLRQIMAKRGNSLDAIRGLPPKAPALPQGGGQGEARLPAPPPESTPTEAVV